MFDGTFTSLIDATEHAEAELAYYAEIEAEDAEEWLNHATAHGIYVDAPVWHYNVEPLGDSVPF